MTKQSRSRRMQALVGAILAILGLAAILRSGAAYLEHSSIHVRNTAKPTGSVEVDGVEFHPLSRVSPRKAGRGQTYRATVEAYQPGGGELMWEVTVRKQIYPAGRQDMHSSMNSFQDPFKNVSPQRVFDQIVLKLPVKGRGILATFPDGAEYSIDPATRKVLQLKAPTPRKRPILDARLPPETQCKIHDRILIEGIVPIRYGFGLVRRADYEAQVTRFPYAISSTRGGCMIEEANEAQVRYCPDCREVELEYRQSSSTKPPPDKNLETYLK